MTIHDAKKSMMMCGKTANMYIFTVSGMGSRIVC